MQVSRRQFFKICAGGMAGTKFRPCEKHKDCYGEPDYKIIRESTADDWSDLERNSGASSDLCHDSGRANGIPLNAKCGVCGKAFGLHYGGEPYQCPRGTGFNFRPWGRESTDWKVKSK